MKLLDSLKLKTIHKVVIGFSLLFMVLSIIMVVTILKEAEEALEYPKAIDEILPIIDTMEVNTENTENTEDIIQSRNMNTQDSIDMQSDEVPIEEDTVEEQETDEVIDPYSIITNDIEAIKNKDPETIVRYFGTSEIFTPEIVSDKLTATLVTFISQELKEDNTVEVIMHICTLDYDKLKEDSDSLVAENQDTDVTLELAKGVVNGNYDVHYTIPVIIKDNQVKVSEELKQAITGNWYKGLGIELTQAECPLESKEE